LFEDRENHFEEVDLNVPAEAEKIVPSQSLSMIDPSYLLKCPQEFVTESPKQRIMGPEETKISYAPRNNQTDQRSSVLFCLLKF